MSTPDNRSVNFFSLFRRGQHYSKTWPLEKRLAPVFVENRVIKMTCYAIRFMPPIAVFTLCWQIALGGQLGPAVATALFALIVVAGQAFCNAITSCNPQLVL